MAVGDGDGAPTTHDLAFVVHIGVVFARAFMSISARHRIAAGVELNQFFRPTFVVGMQAGFVIVR